MTGHAKPEKQPATSGGGVDTRLDSADLKVVPIEVQVMAAWAPSAALTREIVALRAENAELRKCLRWALDLLPAHTLLELHPPSYDRALELLEEKP